MNFNKENDIFKHYFRKIILTGSVDNELDERLEEGRPIRDQLQSFNKETLR